MAISIQALKQKAYFELKEFLIIVLYLWVVFVLFLLYKSVILHEEHISFLGKGLAVINALVLGKVILIGKALHVGDRFNNWPLIYPTLIKSALFSIALAIVKVLEAAAVSLYYRRSFEEAIADFGGGTLQGILTLTVLMFVVLIPFFGFTELRRVLGGGKLERVFFGPRELENQQRGKS